VTGVTEEASADGDVFGLSAPRLVLVLQLKADHVKRCSKCGAPIDKVHDVRERRVRDLPIGAWDAWLVFPRARVECPHCGPTVKPCHGWIGISG